MHVLAILLFTIIPFGYTVYQMKKEYDEYKSKKSKKDGDKS